MDQCLKQFQTFRKNIENDWIPSLHFTYYYYYYEVPIYSDIQLKQFSEFSSTEMDWQWIDN